LSAKNNIFGESVNPLNFERTAGGSSGGDAGMVASKCIPLSICTDIGGGMRYPAAFCGVYTMKPTAKRCSSRGLNEMSKLRFNAFQSLECVAGPICSSVDDCVLSMKVQFDPKIHLLDPEKTPSEFNEEMFQAV